MHSKLNNIYREANQMTDVLEMNDKIFEVVSDFIFIPVLADVATILFPDTF